jgi:hypothetical protein
MNFVTAVQRYNEKRKKQRIEEEKVNSKIKSKLTGFLANNL